MKTAQKIAAVALSVAAVTASAETAFSQNTVERGVSVYNRPRPDYDALGLRLGSFFLFPTTSISEEYNDNIYASKNDKEDDFITILNPSAKLVSNWSRHALTLDAFSRSGFYADHSSQNFWDFGAGANGRVDIQRSTWLDASASAARLHEAAGSENFSGNWKEPSEYYNYRTQAKLSHVFNRLAVAAGGAFDRKDYQDVQLRGGGTDNQTNRDRNVYEAFSRFAYNVNPNLNPFVEGRYNWRRYDTDDGGISKDSQGYRAGVGVAMDFGGVTTGEMQAGWMQQNYDDYDDQGSWYVSGGLLFTPTQLTSIRFDVDRSFQETTFAGSSGYVDTGVALRLEHELRRNILLYGEGSFNYDDYDGIDLKEKVYVAGFGGNYLVNRHLRLGLGYTYSYRDSDYDYREYKVNQVLLSVIGSL